MEQNKVRISEKLGLSMVCIGNAPIMYFLSTYFMLFFSTVVGLDIAALATLFLISRVTDGISDPIMGFIMDKFPNVKMGKFRTMLIFGTIICVINYILLWFGPIWSPAGKYVIVYITYLLLGLTFDIMDISKNSMLPVMSSDEKVRNGLALTQSLGLLVGGAIFAVASPFIVAETTLRSYYILVLGGMALTLIFSIGGALLIKERVKFKGTKEEKYSFKELLGFFKFKPIWGLFVASLALGLSTNLSSGAGTFYYTYVLGDLTLMSGVAVVTLVAALIGMLIAPALANKFDKRKIFMASLIICIIFTAIRIIDVRSMLLLYVCSFLGGIGGGMVIPMTSSILADNTSYIRYKTGKRAEAAIASLNSFIAKVSGGLGGAIPGYVLAATGFVRGSVVQPESINRGIIICLIIIPVILCVIGTLAFNSLYRIDPKEVDDMKKSIATGNQYGIPEL